MWDHKQQSKINCLLGESLIIVLTIIVFSIAGNIFVEFDKNRRYHWDILKVFSWVVIGAQLIPSFVLIVLILFKQFKLNKNISWIEKKIKLSEYKSFLLKIFIWIQYAFVVISQMYNLALIIPRINSLNILLSLMPMFLCTIGCLSLLTMIHSKLN